MSPDALSAHLDALPGTTALVTPSFGPPDPASVGALADRLGHPLPPDLAGFYDRADGLSVSWWHADPGEARTAFGDIRLVALDEVVAGLPPGSIPGEDPNDQTVPIDLLHHRHAVVARVRPDGCDLDLILPGARALRLNLDLETYLDRALAVGGLYGWQFRCAEDAQTVLEETSDDGFYPLAAALFPEADLDVFLHRGVPSETWAPEPYARRFDEAFGGTPGGATVQTYDRAGPARPSAIRRAELALGVRLPAGLVAFYRQMDGVRVEWDAERCSGQFTVLSVGEMVGGPGWASREPWSHDAATQFGLAESPGPLQNALPFVIAPDDDVVLRPGMQPPLGRLGRDGIQPLPPTVPEFLNGLIQSRGVGGWTRDFLGSPPEGLESALRAAYPDASLPSE